ncbi:hypothetical protein EV702DRAFT_188063 [Suillus placidus]|uniref:Hydrophobin n=1 Tax=Suillus placidus TaxID=48579 RepID=A0A9P6ZWL5_9AGAM|nr:hypothetical protein EV702DRAFT_188063 [Suillus placidus]
MSRLQAGQLASNPPRCVHTYQRYQLTRHKMLKRIVALLSLTILVVAGDSQCDTGTIMCCDLKSTSSEAAEYFAQREIVKRRATNECSGVSVVGTSQSCSANQEPLCCEKVTTNGLVNLSCSPINVNA